MKNETLKNISSESDYYTCTKSGKKIEKSNPQCPTPSTYCKYRTACIIFDLYKENLKKEKNIKKNNFLLHSKKNAL